MALPPFLSIDGADPAQQGQTLIGNDSNENFVLESTGGLGTIRNFRIKGEGGNDTLTLVGSPVGTNVFGNDGEDFLTVDNKGTGSISDSKFFGGDDNDTVRLENVLMTGTGAGTSQIGTGNGGDEIFLSGDFFNTNMFAGNGNDLVTFTGKSSYKSDARAFTGDGNDTMTDGGFEVDFTNTEFGFKGGNDIVDFSNSFTGQDGLGMEAFLGEGNDDFRGPASGDVSLLGGGGNDTIVTFDGDDSIEGGAGHDSILSGKGNDTVFGGDNNDFIDGQDGQDSLFGDAGSDLIFGRNDNDTINGGADADFVSGGFGDDSIFGGLGVSDVVKGSPTIFSEDDTLVGNVGNDTILGQSGDDIIWGGSFNNLGGDTEEVEEIIDDKFGGTIDLGDIPLDKFKFAPGVNAGEGPADTEDSLLGNSGNDILFGSAGFDTLDGGVGSDIIMGNADADYMTGGTGHDIFIQENGASTDVDDVSVGDNLTITFENNFDGDDDSDPVDIITDFQATDGAGNAVDKIAFEGWDGGFDNNLGSATGTFGNNNVVVYSGIYNALNNTFITTDNSVGPDVLAFRSNGTNPNLTPEDFGDQSVILLGAAGQGIDQDNFIPGFA